MSALCAVDVFMQNEDKLPLLSTPTRRAYCCVFSSVGTKARDVISVDNLSLQTGGYLLTTSLQLFQYE
jgi:hypothetical protein